jgi:quercetin dioxygenase-like cupin family protein
VADAHGGQRHELASVQAAEVVLPCRELDETLAFFTGRLGFRVAAVFPAHAPSVAVVAGHGLRIRLQRYGAGPPGVLRLLCRDPAALGAGAPTLTAPNGTRVELVAWEAPLSLPPLRPSFALTRLRDGRGWGSGRAGMQYRDLIPGRQGGRFIASHIRIPDAGPVPDYVHFHRVRFQMIYCYRGWARVVYEDQGPPFLLRAGDCVLQPPRIRHRVLESSAGLEVIEISSPAEHETLADFELELPTRAARPNREFDGQRFVRAEAAPAAWTASIPGFEARDLGIAAATDQLASAAVLRWRAGTRPEPRRHGAELSFSFVLDGTATLDCEGHGTHRVQAGDAFVVPAGLRHSLTDCDEGLELLEVTVGQPSQGMAPSR